MESTHFAVISSDSLGLSFALMLSNIGLKVDVYESNNQFDFEDGSNHGSYVLSIRGIEALKKAGIDVNNLTGSCPIYGLSKHLSNGELDYYQYGR